jgi:hypothetical protein
MTHPDSHSREMAKRSHDRIERERQYAEDEQRRELSHPDELGYSRWKRTERIRTK